MFVKTKNLFNDKNIEMFWLNLEIFCTYNFKNIESLLVTSFVNLK